MRRSAWIPALLAAALGAGGCGGSTVTVPPVTGPNVEANVFQAYDLLRSAGLRVEIANDFEIATREITWEVGVRGLGPVPEWNRDRLSR